MTEWVPDLILAKHKTDEDVIEINFLSFCPTHKTHRLFLTAGWNFQQTNMLDRIPPVSS